MIPTHNKEKNFLITLALLSGFYAIAKYIHENLLNFGSIGKLSLFVKILERQAKKQYLVAKSSCHFFHFLIRKKNFSVERESPFHSKRVTS